MYSSVWLREEIKSDRLSRQISLLYNYLKSTIIAAIHTTSWIGILNYRYTIWFHNYVDSKSILTFLSMIYNIYKEINI